VVVAATTALLLLTQRAGDAQGPNEHRVTDRPRCGNTYSVKVC